MLRSFVRATAVGLVGASLLAAVPAAAQDVGKIVGYRQGIMKALGWHIGPIAGMAKGDIAFDQAALQHHADALAALAKMTLEGFPEGSTADNSKAKADIWTNWADFGVKVEGLETATAALAAGAAGITDASGIGALLGPVGGACKACHDSYRAQ